MAFYEVCTKAEEASCLERLAGATIDDYRDPIIPPRIPAYLPANESLDQGATYLSRVIVIITPHHVYTHDRQTYETDQPQTRAEVEFAYRACDSGSLGGL